MCFEFEIPSKKKDKNLNMIDQEFEVESELEKFTRTSYYIRKIKTILSFFVLQDIFGLARFIMTYQSFTD